MVCLDEPAATFHYVGFGNHSFTARCPGYTWLPFSLRVGGVLVSEGTCGEDDVVRGPDPPECGLGPRWSRLYRLLVCGHFPGVPGFAAQGRVQNGVQIHNAGVRVQLSQPSPELRLAEFENIRKWVDVADRLGASHVRVFGGNVPKGATEQQAIAWASEVLKRGADYAGTKGITLGVENDYGLTVEAGAAGRGRDAGCPAPPAQIPTSGTTRMRLLSGMNGVKANS